MWTRFLARVRNVDRSPAAPDGPADVTPMLRLAEPLLSAVAAPRVAVISRGPAPHVVTEVERAFPDATVHAYDASVGLRELHLALATRGRFTLVLDDGGAAGAARRFRTAFFHLAHGGALVMRVAPGADGHPSPLSDLLKRLAAARAGEPPSPPRPESVVRDPRSVARRDFDALALSFRRLDVRPPYVVAVSKMQVLAKVREGDMDRLLAARAGEDRVVDTLPAQTLTSRCEVRSNDADSVARLRTTFEVPALSIREYHEVLCRWGQIALKDNLVLPESFRHPLAPRMVNMALADWAPDFVREPVQAAQKERPLRGAYFYLDNEHKMHFGHVVSEQLSHLWAWERVRELDPTARVLIPASARRDSLQRWQHEFLEAAGVSGDTLVLAQGPVRVETLFTASPMYTMPHYVHPEIEETWTRIGDHLDARAPDRDYPRRIFCSRRTGKRGCLNGAEVEELFVRNGFEVVFPEDYPVAEQVRMFRRAEVIAGYAGSGMFTIAFTGGPRHVVVVGHASYTPTNEYMMSSVLGHRLDLVVSQPEIPRPAKGMSRETYHSDFTFAAEREGRFLREVLDGL